MRESRTIVIARPLHPARAALEVDVRLRRAVRSLPPGVGRRVRAITAPVAHRWPVKTAP
jgi:hypothetical protein